MARRSLGIVYNPISGRGRAKELASTLARLAIGQGIEVKTLESAKFYQEQDITIWLKCRDAVIICGGDGTLAPLLSFLATTATPVYMLPAGNESLFARHFAMTADPEQAISAYLNGTTKRHYYAEVNGRPFFHMTSIGLDAEVVQTISETRPGPIKHTTYIPPAIRRAVAHRPPRFDLTVDGQSVLENKPGFLIIANSHEYALRLPLAPNADSRVPVLVAWYYPYRHVSFYLRWIAAVICRKPKLLGERSGFAGREIKVQHSTGDPLAVQADGEFVGVTPANVNISANCILVLEPIGRAK